jgi:NDP-sugar pyrophosphorylase family protein
MPNPIDTAVILCAGVGSRLGTRTADTPKVMLPVGGTPLLLHHIDWMHAAGFRRVFINLHHCPDRITGVIGDGSHLGVHVTYSYEPVLMGTGGALYAFRDELPENFLVHYGDIYSEVDLHALGSWHLGKGGIGTLVVQPTSRPHDSDIVEAGVDDSVVAVHHKPGHFGFGDLGNAACKIFNRKILRYLPSDGRTCDLVSDVIAGAVAAGEKLFVYKTSAVMYDIGTAERFKEAEEHVLYARR